MDGKLTFKSYKQIGHPHDTVRRLVNRMPYLSSTNEKCAKYTMETVIK